MKKIRVEQGLSIELYSGRTKLPDLSSQKANALLRFLVSHAGKRFSRSSLQERFWRGVSPQCAQLSLRQALFAISKALAADSPIAATRTEVFCKSTRVYVSRKSRVKTIGQHGPRRSSKGLEKKATQVQDLLAQFRRNSLSQFISEVPKFIGSQSMDKASEFNLRFFLAYANNELGNYSEGLKIANSMVNEAQTRFEHMLANHALGGLLWHGGHFNEGLSILWEAANLAEGDASSRFHILSNIAIGSFEAKRPDLVQYSVRIAESHSGFGKQHDAVLGYIKALELVSQQNYVAAKYHVEKDLNALVRVASRVDVYLFELSALIEMRLGNLVSARSMMNQSKVLRRAFEMHQSPVEKRRIRVLEAEINRGLQL